MCGSHSGVVWVVENVDGLGGISLPTGISIQDNDILHSVCGLVGITGPIVSTVIIANVRDSQC